MGKARPSGGIPVSLLRAKTKPRSESRRRGQAGPTMTRRTTAALLFLAFFLLSSVFAFAQSPTTGCIAGNIKDPNDAAVAGAAVTAINSVTGYQESVTTDSLGNYV